MIALRARRLGHQIARSIAYPRLTSAGADGAIPNAKAVRRFSRVVQRDKLKTAQETAHYVKWNALLLFWLGVMVVICIWGTCELVYHNYAPVR